MRPKLKKTLIVVFVTILIIVVAIIVFISPIAKYLIEKYDEKFTGRQIEVEWAYVNPFTGYIYVSDLKLYESKSDSIFLSVNSLSANFELLKIFSKTYEISHLILTEPKGVVIQDKKVFNFNDLIKKITPEVIDTTKLPTHFNLLNIKIIDGEFHYREKSIPVTYYIKKVNIETTGMRWDVDTVALKFSFLSGPGSGHVKGSFAMNNNTQDYRLTAQLNKYDLKFIEQYVKDISNYGNFSANLDADMHIAGNFEDQNKVSTFGVLSINDFHFGKDPDEDYASFDKLTFAIREVNPEKRIYSYDSISLQNPYFKYERYDRLDNLQNMFGKNGSNIEAAKSEPDKFNLIFEIADYIKILARNFFKSNYKINRLAIYSANLKFNDYSISEKFSIALDPFYIIADSIHKTKTRVKVAVNSGIKPYGNMSVNLSMNPKDSSDFEMNYHFDKLPSSMFNPYIISYTSFALDRGTMEFKGNWNVKNGEIRSTNHLLIIDPRSTKRLRNKDTKWVPMPLVMAFIRERGDVIDYEIPIQGNLNDPKFHLRDVIFDLLENIFLKPPTTPYRLQVKTIDAEIEKSLTLKWDMRQSALMPNQEKFIERMVEFLVDNPEASIDVYPNDYALKEKEYISFYEAKKKHFLINNSAAFSFDDSLQVSKMSVKDSAFVKYLNKQLNDSMLFTIQDKCRRFIGSDFIDRKFDQLKDKREKNFLFFFKEKNVEGRIKLHAGKKVIPYNGFSTYKIEYRGVLPEPLYKAYDKMNELDNKAPRKEYKKERKKAKAERS